MPAANRLTPAFFRRTFSAAYLRANRRLHPLSDVEIEAWIAVLAAARLIEGIRAEEMMPLQLAGAVGIIG